MLTDIHTPVGIYLKLRDKFPNSILLESSDYHGNKNSYSFICCNPIATFKAENNSLTEKFPDGSEVSSVLIEKNQVQAGLKMFGSRFEIDKTDKADFNYISNGLFGYTSYDAVRYFENIKIKCKKEEATRIPDMLYMLYQFVIEINHFNEEAYIIESTCVGFKYDFSIEQIEALLTNKNVAQFRFSTDGREEPDMTDERYMEIVKKGKEECKRGNIFQVVLSREYSQPFKGDEFNVYRALRSINPSPYLFYFDYGDFKILGSSPEAQLVVQNQEAQIHPIAGTIRRAGDDNTDRQLAEKLREDKKEKAEHVMLVDLARNDLSRSCTDIKVDVFAETQFFSHLIHLVSKVTGKLNQDANSIRVFADTFPAGTLSGAPKHRAMQIIDEYESHARGYYGGAIGFLGFNGAINHAIIIRSFLSKGNRLFYRAGAGVTQASSEENELQEVKNKLAALKSAIAFAKEI